MSVMQAECRRPERTVIGHPFNPPHVIPLVEVVGGKYSARTTQPFTLSAAGGVAKFTLTGEAVNLWVNGTRVSPAAQFSADVKRGLNTIVIRVEDTRVPDVVKLESRDVTFVTGEVK